MTSHAVAPNAGRNVRCTCGAEYSLTRNLMAHITQNNPLTAGNDIRVSDDRGICGGGVILSVDSLNVTVAQPYSHRHNGRILERGTRPMRYALATHTFELAGR